MEGGRPTDRRQDSSDPFATEACWAQAGHLALVHQAAPDAGRRFCSQPDDRPGLASNGPPARQLPCQSQTLSTALVVRFSLSHTVQNTSMQDAYCQAPPPQPHLRGYWSEEKLGLPPTYLPLHEGMLSTEPPGICILRSRPPLQ